MSAPAARLRPARYEDLAALWAIESRAHSHPWSRSLLEGSLDSADSVIVAEDGDARILGYAVLSVAIDDADLLNIAVEPRLRRRGIGAVLLEGVLAEAKRRGARQCFLEVRSGNQPALALYRRFGFTEVGRRRDYYPADVGREDARVLCLEFNSVEKPS